MKVRSLLDNWKVLAGGGQMIQEYSKLLTFNVFIYKGVKPKLPRTGPLSTCRSCAVESYEAQHPMGI